MRAYSFASNRNRKKTTHTRKNTLTVPVEKDILEAENKTEITRRVNDRVKNYAQSR